VDYSQTHIDIVKACMANDRRAQFELYKLYSKGMYNVCLRMVNNESDAEDILQHSFMDVYSKLHLFKFESSIGAWIKRIVINNSINFLKKRKLQISELSDQVQLPVQNEEIDDNLLEIQSVKSALLKLPEGYRVVFNLYAFEGYDHKEIGQIIGVTEATSKSQYSRAKKKIKEIIKSDFVERI
jgi:RNA polymerase sigma factor (sigma-70 family)